LISYDDDYPPFVPRIGRLLTPALPSSDEGIRDNFLGELRRLSQESGIPDGALSVFGDKGSELEIRMSTLPGHWKNLALI
jgi:hypothetical protein